MKAVISTSSTGSAIPSAGKARMLRPSEVNQAVMDYAGVVDATSYGVKFPAPTGARNGLQSWPALALILRDSSRIWRAGYRPMPARFSSAFAPHSISPKPSSKKKQELVREGFDPRLVTDALFLPGRPGPASIGPIDAELLYAAYVEIAPYRSGCEAACSLHAVNGDSVSARSPGEADRRSLEILAAVRRAVVDAR